MELSYKTRYWLLSLLILLSVTARSQQKNVISISDAKVSIGEAQLPVAIENTDEIVGAQFDLTLPSTISAGTEAIVTNRCDGHTVIIRNIEATRYRVMLYSDDNRPLIAQQGTVLYVPLNIPQTVTEGSELPLVISNATLTVASGENVLTETKAGKLIVSLLPDLTVMNIAPGVQGDSEALTIIPGDHLSLSWQVQNVGEAATKGGWSEQIMVVNKRGTVTKLIGTVYQQETLAAGAVMSRQADIIVPQLLGVEGDVYVQVRIIAASETGESTLAAGNNTAQSDNVFTVSKRLFVEPNPIRIVENSTSRVAVKVSRSGDWNTEQTFTLSTNGDTRVTLPSQVTMPIGQSGAIVYMTVKDNSVLDDDDIVIITAKGNGYADAQGELTIEDNEYPNLTLTTSKSAVTEGEAFQLTVTASRVSKEPIIVTLASENVKRFTFPQTVTIPAGEASVTVDVEAVDDNSPSAEIDNAFTASAFHYNRAEVYVLLQDDDMPTISLSLSPTTLTESAGPVAMMAVLRRTSHVDQDITVKLSDDSQYHDINYGQFSSISMAKGVEEVSFSLGINDNLNVDGDRDVTITAAVYIQSCSCSAANEGAGVVSQKIHIIDNDGPSLSITSSRSMLLEGAEEATVLTISRNTPVTQTLTISISSNYDEGLEYSHSVVIPAGEKTVKVPVKTLTNYIQDDNITVTFTVTAEGHSNGTCWAMISDQTLPDAIIGTMDLLSVGGDVLENGEVMVNTKVMACFTVNNIGVIDLPAGTVVSLYQNTQRVTSMTTSQPLASGESVTFTYILTVPNRIGTFSVHAKVNGDQSVHELIYANNISPTATVQVRGSFSAAVSVDKNVLQYGDSLTVSGQLSQVDGTTWKTDGSTAVDLYLIADGQRYVQRVQADATGAFSFRWGPSRSQMGHVSIGACYPGDDIRTEMVGVDIYGMRRVSDRITSFYTILDNPYTGSITITNPGRLPLTDLTITITSNSDEASVTFDAPNGIAGGETVDIGYTLIGHKLGGDNEWQTLSFTMTTTEGPQMSHTLYYYTRNPQAQLSCSIKQINTTVTKGNSRDLTFDVANIGLGNTGVVSLALPQWIQSVTPKQMSSMAQGDTTQVVIRLVPTDDMQLNVPVTGQIAVNCENGNGVTIPFQIEPVSELTGKLLVDVCDEYTYYTDEAPHVSGATVSILHPVTGAVIDKGITDASGCFSVTLAEGYYSLLVTHPKHDSYRVNFQLDPGKTTYKVVNLIYDAIEVSWDVVDTTVEDVYDIVTTVKYETRVPVPVVSVVMPQNIEAHKLEKGESLVFYAVMTNKGLISAKDVQLSMPEGFTELTFEPLDMDEPFELAPQQSAVMPIKVTRLPQPLTNNSRRRVYQPLSEDDCYAKFPLAYYYVCGTDRKYHKYYNGLRVAECEGKTVNLDTTVETDTEDDTQGWGYGDNGGTGGVGRPNYPGNLFGTAKSNQTRVESTGEPYQCTPCAGLGLYHALKLLPVIGPVLEGADVAKDIYNCAYALTLDDGIHDKLANCKYTAGAVQRYDRYINTAKDIYNDFGLAVDGALDVVALAQNGQFFTQNSLDAWKSVFDGIYHTVEDAASFYTQTQSYVNDIQNMSDNISDEITELYNDKRAWENGNARVFYLTDDQRYNFQQDHEKEWHEQRAAKAQQLTQQAKDEVDANISTMENYNNILKGLVDMGIKGEATREDWRKIGQDCVMASGDLLYNIHREFDMAYNNFNATSTWNLMDYFESSDVDPWGNIVGGGNWDPHGNTNHAKTSYSPILKMDYIDATNKLVEKSDDVMDMLYYTFGGCDYEGTEEDAGNEENQSEGDVGIDGRGKTRRIQEQYQSYSRHRALSYTDNSLPLEYKEFLEMAGAATNMVKINGEIELEYYGESAWLNLSYSQTAPVAWAIEQVEKEGALAIDNPNISIYCPDGISLDRMKRFLRRWYNTYYVPKNSSAYLLPDPDGVIRKIDLQRMTDLSQDMLDESKLIFNRRNAGKRRFSSDRSGVTPTIAAAVLEPFNAAVEKMGTRSNSVCATITLQFNQTMTMTRQAFRGTLKVHNGNTEESMKDVVLELEVRNASDGSVATSREMQMNVESLDGFEGSLNFTDGWTLEANGDGTATILFIPSKYAAPTESVDYTFGGRLKYLDPFTGLMVTRELSPVTLTVKPSPELDLTYFMQRDVYGDDPLTLDVVEAMEPAEFALLINNKGYGDATNVKMLTKQPEIIENEKGLLIDFELISSQVNGSDATLSLGQSIANDFGTIPAHSQMYAQWWLTSTLLGHFTEYDVHATHVTSYGNPDLSLLDQVTIHELIHGFDLPNGSLIGGPEKGRAFLVNDIVDANDLPDKLYFTNGDTAGVSITTTAKIERTSPTTCLLTITPSVPGWNYGSLLDPTHGYAELRSIVRQSDGQELGNTRFWQTDRTLRDGKDWLYEYRLHFVDEFKTGAPVTYLLTFDPVPEEVLEVASIGVVPAEGQTAEEPIETLTVTFNKPVDASTFTSDDIMLAVQGAKQDASKIGISTEDNKSFVLDMKAINPQLDNGYYTLTVQTTGITDVEGFQGRAGKQVGWIMFRGGLVQLLTSAWPKNAGTVMRKSKETAGSRRLVQGKEGTNDNTAQYGSTITLVAMPDEGYEFTNWTLNGEVVSTDAELETMALGDMDVVANFTKKKYMVNINVDGAGGTTDGTATGFYEYETEISVMAIPDNDFALENWIVNGKVVEGSGNKLTVTVDKPLEVQASFMQEYFYQRVTLDEGWNWISAYLSEPWAVADWSRYANRIISQTDEAVNDSETGMTGGLSELMSGQAYKVEANSRFTNTLRGHLYNMEMNPINLRKGWNWVAFPYRGNAPVDVVITAEEGDFIISQTGFAEYVDGTWAGTLDKLMAGEGYLYKSASEKNLVFDKSKIVSDNTEENEENITNQDVDVHRYPNTMNMTVRICRDGSEILGEGYSIYAMVGDELRGVSQHIAGNHYLTVYGDNSTDVTFFVESTDNDETFEAHETLSFRDDVVGSRKSPFTINVGELTGIDALSSDGKMTIYTVEGVLVSQEATMKTLLSLPKGVYIINGQKRFVK